MISVDKYQDKVGFFLMSDGEVIEHAADFGELIEFTLNSEHLGDGLARKLAIGMLREKDYIVNRAEDGYGGKRVIGNFYNTDYFVVVVQPD